MDKTGHTPKEYIGKICPYCKTAFVEGDEIVQCSACEMPHHKDCWIENQGCTTFGCQGTIRGLDGQAYSPDDGRRRAKSPAGFAGLSAAGLWAKWLCLRGPEPAGRAAGLWGAACGLWRRGAGSGKVCPNCGSAKYRRFHLLRPLRHKDGPGRFGRAVPGAVRIRAKHGRAQPNRGLGLLYSGANASRASSRRPICFPAGCSRAEHIRSGRIWAIPSEQAFDAQASAQGAAAPEPSGQPGRASSCANHSRPAGAQPASAASSSGAQDLAQTQAPARRSSFARPAARAIPQGRPSAMPAASGLPEQARPAQARETFCQVCGAKNPAEAVFCYGCGAKLYRPGQQEQPGRMPRIPTTPSENRGSQRQMLPILMTLSESRAAAQIPRPAQERPAGRPGRCGRPRLPGMRHKKCCPGGFLPGMRRKAERPGRPRSSL